MSPKPTFAVRCKLTKQAVWKSLSTKTVPNITSVEVLPNVTGLSEALSVVEVIPPGVTSSGSEADATTTEAQAAVENDLIAALHKMKSLKCFTWRYGSGPVLEEELWSTLKELGVSEIRVKESKNSDFLGMPAGSIDFRSVFESSTFLSLTNLKSLELETKFVDGSDSNDDEKNLSALRSLIQSNAKYLERLNLNFVGDGCVNVSKLLSDMDLPQLKEITFARASSSPKSLSKFLSKHSSIASLSLSPMMAGRRWEKLSLPADALPKLMHLNCSPFQAAKILGADGSTHPLLFSLTGIDVRQTVRLSDYFDNNYVDAYDEDEADAYEEVDTYAADQSVTASWIQELFAKLKLSKSITHVALYENDGPKDLEVLAELMPQIRWVDVGTTREDATSKGSWVKTLSAFPELRTLHMRGTGLFLDPKPGSEMLSTKTEYDIRALAQSCPNLVAYEDWSHSVIVHREGKMTLKVEQRVEPQDGLKEELVWPSESFVRATMRKFGGPSQPGPGVLEGGF